ncbi:MAG: 2'-5' RNA ligase family protein [Bacteroidetes bacterium]|nr:2'-5' RNA ligase family protein [Bacteroidota bacterium]
MLVNDYLLIIEPSNDVKEKVNALKKSFAEKYECTQALHSKPHLTLLRFMQYDMNERNIVRKLELLVNQYAAFMVLLNDFGSFPTHTIYVNVETKNNIVDLVKSLKPAQAFLKYDKEHKPHFITTPHITITRKLLPWQYEKGWLELSNTHFNTSFMVSNILLLKRNIEQKHYTLAATFELMGKKEVLMEQVSLF